MKYDVGIEKSVKLHLTHEIFFLPYYPFEKKDILFYEYNEFPFLLVM